MKLQTKLGVFITIATLGSMFGAAVLVFHNSEAQYRKIVEAEQTALGHQTMDTIDRLMYERFQDIQIISSAPTLMNSFSNNTGDKLATNKRLKEQSVLTGPWDLLYAVDKSQNVVISSNTMTPANSKLSDESQVQAAFKKAMNGDTYVSDLVYSSINGLYTVIYAAPIKDANDPARPVRGVLIGNYALPALAAILFEVGHKGEVNLLTHNGTLIATDQTTAKGLYKKNTSKAELIAEATASKDQSATRITEEAGEPAMLSSASVSNGHLSYKGYRWVTIIETPSSAAFEPAKDEALKTALLLSPIGILAAGLCAFLIRYSLIKPLSELQAMAKTLGESNFSARLRIKRRDEIGELGHTFNTMSERLQTSDTALRLAKARSESEKELLSTLLNNLPVGVFLVKAPSGESLLMNKIGAEIVGIKTPDQIDKNAYAKTYNIIREDGSPYPNEEIPLVITLTTGKSSYKNDLIIKRPDGSLLAVNTMSVPVEHDDKGNLTTAAVVFEDISKRLALERTREEFFSIASHELRTPLTAIRGNSAMIQDHFNKILEAEPVLEEMVSDVHESSIRLIEIVNDFLDTSRLEQKRMKFNIAPFNPVILANEVINEYQAAELGKDIELVILRPQTIIPYAMADYNRTKQVLINLIGNCIKFTEKGRIAITFVAEEEFIKVFVSDTGRGIPPENQKLLFRKFEQTGKVILTRDSARGTGLGLYIAKLITESMGGKIKLEHSEIDKGSTFSFTLPLAKPSTISDPKGSENQILTTIL